MKKKTLLALLCISLFLLFTASVRGSDDGPPIKAHAWQDGLENPCLTGGSRPGLWGVENPAEVTRVVPIRFAKIDFLFIQRKGELTSDKSSVTVSNRERRKNAKVSTEKSVRHRPALTGPYRRKNSENLNLR